MPFTAPSEASRWTPEGAPHPQTPNDARVQAVHAARQVGPRNGRGWEDWRREEGAEEEETEG